MTPVTAGLWIAAALAGVPEAPPQSEPIPFRDPLDAWHQRQLALRQLSRELPRLDAAALEDRLDTLDGRLHDVRRWRHQLLRRIDDPHLDLVGRDHLARDLDLLAQEEATLVAQQAMLRSLGPTSPRDTPTETFAIRFALGAPTTSRLDAVPPATHDRVAWGSPAVVAAADRRRHAVALGGDVLVFGAVEGRVVAVGGDVILARQARLHHEPLALGGRVVRAGQPAPLPAARGPLHAGTALGAGAGLGLLGAATMPAATERAGTRLIRHPVRSMARGLLAAVTLALGALVLLLPGWTAPLAAMLPSIGLALGATALVGAVVQVGRLVRRHRAAWLDVVAGCVILCAASLGMRHGVPTWALPGLLVGAIGGLGAFTASWSRPRELTPGP